MHLDLVSSTFVTPSPSSTSKGNTVKIVLCQTSGNGFTTKIVNYNLYSLLISISVKNPSAPQRGESLDHSIAREQVSQAFLIIIYKMKVSRPKNETHKW